MEKNQRRLRLVDEQGHLAEPVNVEAATARRLRLLDALPSEPEQCRLIVRDNRLRLTRTLEDHLDPDEGSGATANHAAEKTEVREIDKFWRELLRIADGDQIDLHRTLRIRPGEETTSKLAYLSLALSLRERAAHRMTSSPPM